MVSLRARKARASYTNVAEGLSDLSSSDDGGDNGEASGSGSGSDGENGGDKSRGRNGDDNDDDDATSVSSGDSSEFRPDGASPEKGQASGKGKGKARAVDSDQSEEDDDEELLNELVNEDDENSNESQDDDIDPVIRSGRPSASATPDFMVVSGGGKKKARVRSRPSGNAGGPRPSLRRTAPSGSSSATYSTYGQSAVNHLPLSYRKLIRESTVSIAKPTQVQRITESDTRKEREKDSTRTHGQEAFPLGHPTPFKTRLTRPPTGRDQGAVDWIDESGDSQRRDKNKKEGWDDKDRIPLLSPWATWRGEGWWPELYRGPKNEASGKKKDWVLRGEIRLGLDDVGRVRREELVCLSELDAELYLPTPINKDGDPWVTCHMGPHDDQRPHNFSLFQSSSLSDTNPLVPHEGYTFFAGGPIWGMDWCPCPDTSSSGSDHSQYLAVSTLPHIDTRPAMGEKWPRESQGCIQIWSLYTAGRNSRKSNGPGTVDTDGDVPMVADEGQPGQPREPGTMRCELVLCVQGGPALEVKWMPLGAWDESDPAEVEAEDKGLPKLGILAAVQVDGSISFYAVPHPRSLRQEHATQPIYLQAHEPLRRLETPDTSCMCFDWISGSRIAVGLANGHLAVWDVLDALRSGTSDDLLPSIYTAVALSSIRTIAVGRVPPLENELNGYPIFLVCGSYDGSTAIVDLRDPGYPIEVNRMRIPSMAVGWAAQMASPILCDIDYIVSAVKIRKGGAGRHHPIASHRGQVWNLASSDYHTMLLTAGADGAVLLSDFHTGFFRKRKTPLVFQRLYEVDYDTHTGEYRMLDNFLPENLPLEAAAARRPPTIAKRSTGDPATNILKTATWTPQVGIHKVVWQAGGGLGRAGWAASGGASGLGRVDWIEGRWKGEK